MRWWAAAPIRVRLTAWYTVALSLMLLVYAATTFFAVRHEFLELLDDQLKDDLEAVEGRLAVMPDGRLTWAARDSDPDADVDADRGSDVWSPAGEHMLSSGVSIGLRSAMLTAATAAPQYSSVDVQGHSWRTLAGPATVSGTAVVLSVSRSEDRLRA